MFFFRFEFVIVALLARAGTEAKRQENSLPGRLILEGESFLIDAPPPPPNAQVFTPPARALTPLPGAFTCPAANNNSFLDFCIESELTTMTSNPGGSGRYVPPDPHGAAGPNSLCSVVNVAFQCIRRNGTSIGTFPATSFKTLFSTFNPTGLKQAKVIYDVHQNRFVMVILDTTGSYPNPVTASRIFVAVSKTYDPVTGTATDWYIFQINSFISNNWADYPGLAVDNQTIYITANMYPAAGYVFQKSFLWIIPKIPFYTGGTPTSSGYDFSAMSGAGFNSFTYMPAMVRALQGIPNNVGTYLVSHSAFTGDKDYVDICVVQNPLGNPPTFAYYRLEVPPVEFNTNTFAPQLGTNYTLSTGDSRALQSVWADNYLWLIFTVSQNISERAVYWGKFSANGVNPPTLVAQGIIDGEDIQAATWTYVPSFDVNSKGVAAFGFTASSTNMYASAYATIRDTTGVVHKPQLIQAGLGPYNLNDQNAIAWGDYTGTSLDPVNDNCFWTFQEYAGDTSPYTNNGQFGHWRNVWGRICFPPLGPPNATTTNAPSKVPTSTPVQPTNPTKAPAHAPTNAPVQPSTATPTKSPVQLTKTPATFPTKAPTKAPVNPGSPTNFPTKAPVKPPTMKPTNDSKKKVTFEVLVKYDDNPDEFAWKIQDLTSKKLVISFPKNLGLQPKTKLTVPLKLQKGHNYKLVASDGSGDGLVNGKLKIRKKVSGKWKLVILLIGKYQQRVIEFTA